MCLGYARLLCCDAEAVKKSRRAPGAWVMSGIAGAGTLVRLASDMPASCSSERVTVGKRPSCRPRANSSVTDHGCSLPAMPHVRGLPSQAAGSSCHCSAWCEWGCSGLAGLTRKSELSCALQTAWCEDSPQVRARSKAPAHESTGRIECAIGGPGRQRDAHRGGREFCRGIGLRSSHASARARRMEHQRGQARHARGARARSRVGAPCAARLPRGQWCRARSPSCDPLDRPGYAPPAITAALTIPPQSLCALQPLTCSSACAKEATSRDASLPASTLRRRRPVLPRPAAAARAHRAQQAVPPREAVPGCRPKRGTPRARRTRMRRPRASPSSAPSAASPKSASRSARSSAPSSRSASSAWRSRPRARSRGLASSSA